MEFSEVIMSEKPKLEDMKIVYQDTGFRSTMRSRVKTEEVDVIKHPRYPNV